MFEHLATTDRRGAPVSPAPHKFLWTLHEDRADITAIVVGNHHLLVRQGLLSTLRQAERELFDRKNIVATAALYSAYAAITGDSVTNRRYEDVYEVVLRWLELKWYEVTGNPVYEELPERFQAALKRCAQETVELAGKTTRRGTISAAQYSLKRVLEGAAINDLVAELEEHYPEVKSAVMRAKWLFNKHQRGEDISNVFVRQ